MELEYTNFKQPEMASFRAGQQVSDQGIPVLEPPLTEVAAVGLIFGWGGCFARDWGR